MYHRSNDRIKCKASLDSCTREEMEVEGFTEEEKEGRWDLLLAVYSHLNYHMPILGLVRKVDGTVACVTIRDWR